MYAYIFKPSDANYRRIGLSLNSSIVACPQPRVSTYGLLGFYYIIWSSSWRRCSLYTRFSSYIVASWKPPLSILCLLTLQNVLPSIPFICCAFTCKFFQILFCTSENFWFCRVISYSTSARSSFQILSIIFPLSAKFSFDST